MRIRSFTSSKARTSTKPIQLELDSANDEEAAPHNKEEEEKRSPDRPVRSESNASHIILKLHRSLSALEWAKVARS